MIDDIQPWPRGHCEAGIPIGPPKIRSLPACERRGRWLVSGVVLCGTCKRAVVEAWTDPVRTDPVTIGRHWWDDL